MIDTERWSRNFSRFGVLRYRHRFLQLGSPSEIDSYCYVTKLAKSIPIVLLVAFVRWFVKCPRLFNSFYSLLLYKARSFDLFAKPDKVQNVDFGEWIIARNQQVCWYLRSVLDETLKRYFLKKREASWFCVEPVVASARLRSYQESARLICQASTGIRRFSWISCLPWDTRGPRRSRTTR